MSDSLADLLNGIYNEISDDQAPPGGAMPEPLPPNPQDEAAALIEAVRRQPVLWDRNSPYYRSKGKHQEWIQVERDLGWPDTSGVASRRKWTALLACFKRQEDRLALGGKERITFPHYEAMRELVGSQQEDGGELGGGEESLSAPPDGGDTANSSSNVLDFLVHKTESDSWNGAASNGEMMSNANKRPRIDETTGEIELPSSSSTPRMATRNAGALRNSFIPTGLPPMPAAAPPPPNCFIAPQADTEFYQFIHEHLKKFPLPGRLRAQADIGDYVVRLTAGRNETPQ